MKTYSDTKFQIFSKINIIPKEYNRGIRFSCQHSILGVSQNTIQLILIKNSGIVMHKVLWRVPDIHLFQAHYLPEEEVDNHQ